jgi:hypothetical protein
MGDGRVLPRDLLDNGKGKLDKEAELPDRSNSDMEISDDSTNGTAPRATTGVKEVWEGRILLRPPIINATGKIATGATTKMLRKQNKLNRNAMLIEQPVTSQWQRHSGATFLPDCHWDQRIKTSEMREMAPQGLTLQHEAAELLHDWEKFGCPTETGRD